MAEAARRISVKLWADDKPPHEGQLGILRSEAQFNVMVAGRGNGKSVTGQLDCIQTLTKAAKKYSDALGWWIAPNYHLGEVGFWPLFKLLKQSGLLAKYGLSSPRYLQLIDGSKIEFLSADNPESLVSRSVDWVYLDECAVMPERVWYESVYGCLMRRGGRALLGGTPKGKNWFYTEYRKGIDGVEGYYSQRCPAWQNPYLYPGGIDDPKIKRAKETLPSWAYQQEVCAEFVDDLTSVFEGLDACILGNPSDPIDGENYFAGIDLGRKVDPSAITIQNKAGLVVCHESLPVGSPWAFQVNSIAAILQKYHAYGMVDATGLGDPVFEELKRKYPALTPMILTNASKQDLIIALAMDIRETGINIPAKYAELISECKDFQFEQLPSGKTSYHAPDGKHDDRVISLALANQVRRMSLKRGAFSFYLPQEDDND